VAPANRPLRLTVWWHHDEEYASLDWTGRLDPPAGTPDDYGGSLWLAMPAEEDALPICRAVLLAPDDAPRWAMLASWCEHAGRPAQAAEFRALARSRIATAQVLRL